MDFYCDDLATLVRYDDGVWIAQDGSFLDDERWTKAEIKPKAGHIYILVADVRKWIEDTIK